jgi:hypothetical protein
MLACGLWLLVARIYREIFFAIGQSAGVNANANDGEAERGARVAGMMSSSRAPICPVFKVMDDELPRALADG